MTLPLLLALSISTTALPPSAASSGSGVTLSQSAEGRRATLLGGLELSAPSRPAVAPALRPLDDVRFALAGVPLALDDGGGMGSDGRQIAALLLGLFIGFGTGHLVANDRNGFILFLIIDLAIIVASSVLDLAIGTGLFWALGGVGLLVSHVIQGLDAYGESGGQRLIQLNRERAVRLASAGAGPDTPAITTRTLAFSF